MGAPEAQYDLSSLALFAGLSTPDLDTVTALLRSEDVATDAVVVSQDVPSPNACVLLAGTLKVYVNQPADAEVVLAVLGPGEIVGELNMIDHLGRSANVVALEPSRLLWLDENNFRDWLKQMPQLAENLLAILARRLRLANARIQVLAALDIQGQVAHQLLALADAYGEQGNAGNVHIRLRLTVPELAGMIGATAKSTHQVLAVFHRNAYVSIDDQQRFTLQNREALTRLCREAGHGAS